MKINYNKYLHKNLINVLKDVLLDVQTHGLKEGHHLYISFLTTDSEIVISKILKQQFPKEMTIVIQYEYWNLKIKKDLFEICLSFNNIRENLIIPFNSVISFADPYADFGLKLLHKVDPSDDNKTEIKNEIKDNVINFNNFRKD